MKRLAPVLLAASLAGSATHAAAPPQAVGINAAIHGNVHTSTAAAPQPRAAVLRARVALADRVQTGVASQVQILLLDRSVFTVGANARLTIDKFVYDPNGGRSLGATVTQGAFRFMSGRADRRGSSAIRTPVASIGVRGTIVEGVVGTDAMAIARSEPGVPRGTSGDPATASLIVLRGPGAKTQAGLIPGAIEVTGGGVTVGVEEPLQAVYVPRAGATPIGPFSISLAGLARLQGLILPSLLTRPLPVRSGGGMPYPQPQSRPYRRLGPIVPGMLLDDPGAGQGPAGGGRYVPGLPAMNSAGNASAPQRQPAPADGQGAAAQPDPAPARDPAPEPVAPSAGQKDPALPPPPKVPGKP